MTDTLSANTTAQLSGKTLVTAEGDWTITGLHSYSRGASAPFAVNSGAAKVSNLDADLLDGQDWSSPTIASPTMTSPVINTAIYSTKLIAGICEGRLTLETGVPVSTSDQTGKTNIFFTPYKGTNIALYDGTTNWGLFPFTERTLALGTLTNDLPYDVFIYNNAGTITLEALAWTSKTVRATALVLQDGVWSKTGALTRRYLGTFHTTSTTTTEDSLTKRLLWNYYNRVPRALLRNDTTDTWSYNIDVFRQANGSTSNQVAVVVGVAETIVELGLMAMCLQATTGTAQSVGIGVDSTTVPSGVWCRFDTPLANAYQPLFSSLRNIPAAGYHFYAWLERSSVAGAATTWVGDGGSDRQMAGLVGHIHA